MKRPCGEATSAGVGKRSGGKVMAPVTAEMITAVGAFLRDECEFIPGCMVSLGDLYERWRDWCVPRGRYPSTVQSFGRQMAGLGLRKRRIRSPESGAVIRYYDGLRLRVP
jgi:putative DNA primase/helicase